MIKDWENFTDRTEWHVFHKRRRSPFFNGLILSAPSVQAPWIPFDHRVKHFGTWFEYVGISQNEKGALRGKMLKYLKRRPQFLLELIEHAKKLKVNNEIEWQSLQKISYKNLPNKELARILKQYAQKLLAYGPFVTMPLFVETYLEETLKTEFKKKFGEKADFWYGIAVDPVAGSVWEEEIDLLRLAIKNPIAQELQTHCEKFSWMKNVGYLEEYYTVSYYKKRIEKLEKKEARHKLAELENHKKDHTKRLNQLLHHFKTNPKLQNLIRTTNEAVYFRSFRTEMYYGSARFFTPLFKEISKRVGATKYSDILWLYWFEIEQLLASNKKMSQSVVDQRKKGYTFITGENGKLFFWDGRQAKKMYAAFQTSEAREQKGSGLIGAAAFVGSASGRVVIIKSLKDLRKVRKGDILVANATNVNFVPALKKVAGIITEEGGILSHAAIISRELRIPCIIGTKIATQVLKDGDRVEVDASKGIVTILMK